MNRLLVGVDDSQINRTIFEEAAKLLMADVIIGENGEDGINRILKTVEEGRVPDIIITDIHMPVMSGLDLIQKMKTHAKTKYIPILVLTTETDYQKKMLGKEYGAAGWMTKPLSPEEIAQVVRRFLRIK